MSPLRAKLIRELQLHRKAPKTIEAYVAAVGQLAVFYGRSPEKITLEEIRDFLHHLITVRKVAYSTCNQKHGNCWTTWAVTRIAWRSAIIGCWTVEMAWFVTRIETARMATDGRLTRFPPRSSCSGFCSTFCRMAFVASATTACWPTV